MVHDWRKGDEIGLVNHLKSVDFARLFQGKNVYAAWAIFKETIEEAIDRYISLKLKHSKGRFAHFPSEKFN